MKRVIAIDPDITRSGVAVLDTATREVRVETLTYFDVLDAIDANYCDDCIVVIEAGWLISKNWHYKPTDPKAVVAKKGLAVGRNQQIGILFCEWCNREGFACVPYPPLRKCWAGTDRKITQAEITQFMNIPRTNQEGRDAALLAWVYAGLPIKVKQTKNKQQ